MNAQRPEDSHFTREETGFRPVPWDVVGLHLVNLDDLPPQTVNEGNDLCAASWVGTDSSDAQVWLCSRRRLHTGTHRASDSVSTVAEWRNQGDPS